MSAPLPRTRLEQLTQQRRRTKAEFRVDFAATAAKLAERITVSERHANRWMAGRLDGVPHASACRVLEELFGEPVEALFGPPAEEPSTAPPRSAVSESRRHDDAWKGSDSADQEVAVAAAESARFGQFAEQSNVGPHTLEQFRADLHRIVTTYPNRPVYPSFVELRELRNRSFELLEGRQYPEQSSELYLIAGLLCGVMANASFDLGEIRAAETQARTAFLCAELAGNNALMAWTRGTQAMIAYWDDRPRAAVDLCGDGWRYMPETGTARVRLASVEARAWARLGDRRATEQALTQADRARNEVAGQDEPGGMLAFPVAKQLYCAAEAHLAAAGRAEARRAADAAAESVQLYLADPAEDRRLGELCLARIDLAAARLSDDELEGSAEQINDVLAISGQRRIESVARRLGQFSRALDRPRFQTASLAQGLQEEIAAFSRSHQPGALPGARA